MNDSKTYTISANLYKAILEKVYVQGVGADFLSDTLIDDSVKEAIKVVEDQQYIYNN